MPPTPTNTTTHTPGPWSYIEDAGSSSFCYEIRAARPLNGPRGIALVYSDTGTDVPTPEDTANAARIVACVNACAGMNDPAADLAAIRAALIDARDRLAGMTGVPNPLGSVRAALSLLGEED